MNQKAILFVAMVMLSILPSFGNDISLEGLSQEEIDKYLDSQRYYQFQYQYYENGDHNVYKIKRRDAYVLETNDGLRYSIEKDRAVVVDCNPSWKGGTIPSTVEYEGNTYPVKAIGAWAFVLKLNVEEIVISEGVTRIEEYAFGNMPSLRRIVLPNSLDSIERSAFYGMSLHAIDFDTPYVVYNSDYLKYYEYPATSNLITSIELPEEMSFLGEDIFGGCANLEYVKFPKKVGYLGDVFSLCCKSFKKIDLPSYISLYEKSFFQRYPLEYLDLSELTFEEWPEDYTNLIMGVKILILPFETESFCGIRSPITLTTVVIPPHVKEIGKVGSIEKATCYGCRKLSDVVNLSEEPQILSSPETNLSFERRNFSIVNTDIGMSKISFGERDGDYFFRTLHVPHGCKQAYLDAGWGEGDRFDAIEEDAEEIYARIKSEGASFIPTIPTGVLATSPASALSVSRQGSVIRITNVNDNTPVDVYSVDGSFLYHTVASNGHALIDVGKQHGILLVKVGGETVKVVY